MVDPELIQQGQQRRKQIIQFVGAFWRNNGMAPSLEEVAVGVGVTRTAVRLHLTQMTDSGQVLMTPGRMRSLRLPPTDSA